MTDSILGDVLFYSLTVVPVITTLFVAIVLAAFLAVQMNKQLS